MRPASRRSLIFGLEVRSESAAMMQSPGIGHARPTAAKLGNLEALPTVGGADVCCSHPPFEAVSTRRDTWPPPLTYWPTSMHCPQDGQATASAYVLPVRAPAGPVSAAAVHVAGGQVRWNRDCVACADGPAACPGTGPEPVQAVTTGAARSIMQAAAIVAEPRVMSGPDVMPAASLAGRRQA